MKLVTDRLIIEELREEHFSQFLVLDQDPEVMKFIRSVSKDVHEGRERFKKIMDYQRKFQGVGAFAVTEKESGAFIGMGFLIHIELKPENKDYEVGFRLGKPFWGKGYATEIARRLIKYGFEELGLQEIFGTTSPDHVVSQKALMKAGLEDLGTASYYGTSRIFKITNHLRG